MTLSFFKNYYINQIEKYIIEYTYLKFLNTINSVNIIFIYLYFKNNFIKYKTIQFN